MLPLMSIIALDFLLTLVIRAILDDTGQEDKDKGKEEEEGEEIPGEAPSSLKEKEDNEVEGKDEEKSSEEAFFNKFGRNLIPLVVKVTRKLLKCSHLYTLSVAAPNVSTTPSPQLSETPSGSTELIELTVVLDGLFCEYSYQLIHWAEGAVVIACAITDTSSSPSQAPLHTPSNYQ